MGCHFWRVIARLYLGDFLATVSSWNGGFRNAKEYKTEINEGKYIIEHKQFGFGHFFWESIPDIGIKNFVIETEISCIKYRSTSSYCLIWGAKDNNNYFQFQCYPKNNLVEITKYTGNTRSTIKSFYSSSFNKELAPNKISIKRVDSTICFFVNQTKEYTCNFQSFFGNYVGYLVFDTTTIEISYLNVYRPGQIASKEIPDNYFKKKEQSKENFDLTFGGAENEYAYSVIQTKDSGYVLAGSTSTKGAGGNDMWVIKINPKGKIEWDKTFGNKGADDLWSIIWQSTNSRDNDDRLFFIENYVVMGESTNPPGNQQQLNIIKLNNNGEVVWNKKHDIKGGLNKYSYTYNICKTNDNGYIIACYSLQETKNRSAFLVLKLNENGDTNWTKTFNSELNTIAQDIIQTYDGGYVFIGFAIAETDEKRDIKVFKLDNRGNTIWEKTYHYGIRNEAFSLKQTKDHGYIIAGSTKVKD